jgi:hypothetical protein
MSISVRQAGDSGAALPLSQPGQVVHQGGVCYNARP